MKYFKIATILLALIIADVGSSHAQKAGDISISANVVYTPNWTNYWSELPYYEYMYNSHSANIGVSAKIQYNISTPIKVEGVFTFFPSFFNLGMWDLSLNAQYLFPVTRRLSVYPIAGLCLSKYKSDGGYTNHDDVYIIDKKVAGKHTIYGVNTGGGIDYKLSNIISLQGELKYVIGFDNTIFSDYYKTKRFMISIGMTYKFHHKKN